MEIKPLDNIPTEILNMRQDILQGDLFNGEEKLFKNLKYLRVFITDDRTRKAWDSISRNLEKDVYLYFGDTRIKVETEYEDIFYIGLSNALHEAINYPELNTTTERDVELQKAINNIEKAISCINNSGIELSVHDMFGEGVSVNRKTIFSDTGKETYAPMNMSAAFALKSLNRLITKEIKKQQRIKSPNNENAKIKYFCIVLTNYFICSLEKPLRYVVATFAMVFFDKEIDEEDVRRYAPVNTPTDFSIFKKNCGGDSFSSKLKNSSRYFF